MYEIVKTFTAASDVSYENRAAISLPVVTGVASVLKLNQQSAKYQLIASSQIPVTLGCVICTR